MGDHLALDVNRPIKRSEEMEGPSSSDAVAVVVDESRASHDDEEAPLLSMAECRICQEEDSVDALETPCSCNGSLKVINVVINFIPLDSLTVYVYKVEVLYAHRKCVQHWCNEKGDITCEICHQPYQPGYVAPPPRPCLEETTIDIGGAWQISEADRQYLEAEYDDYNATNASGAAFCRSAVLILMALLLLRHASSVPDSDGDGDEDASTFLTLFLLRIAGFLLPCYIMVWAISILQRRRQRQLPFAKDWIKILSWQLIITKNTLIIRFGPFRMLKKSISGFPKNIMDLARDSISCRRETLVNHMLTIGVEMENWRVVWIGTIGLQEAAALAAAQFAFVLQAGQRRGLHFTEAAALAAAQFAFVLQAGQRRGLHFTAEFGCTSASILQLRTKRCNEGLWASSHG
ncbi:zinc finger, RING-CH-type, Zinc finger, RING/FYVE/PHD-type [Artemisia annua]|uniref:Zinc finger, RING-CH-type, Zinc finger, RING/FYVE/PHD-type n=1 Tax=Artemisia annua TaxID=35608 RepID=A0A2U1KI78_ARTAN|nr:zinc finger, RING-CH-type, Zinc finger, RING/FYVE/PHD-type [Artemisia annua]